MVTSFNANPMDAVPQRCEFTPALRAGFARGILVAGIACLAGGMLTVGVTLGAHAGQPATPPAGGSATDAPSARAASEGQDLKTWLMRIHEAAQARSYQGTFVVSAGERMSSSRIVHMCDGADQYERIDILDGQTRMVFRHNDLVHTLLPDSKVAVVERHEALRTFPALLKSDDARLADYYQVQLTGTERVAGFDANVLHVKPRDGLRFGYRLWSEKETGLLLKSQVLGDKGQVLEQAAFSELTLNIPTQTEKIAQPMKKLDGYRVERLELVKTTPAAEGWGLKQQIPGFKPVSCVKRSMNGAAASKSRPGAMQWIFSDGLASVSVFAEPFDASRHQKEMTMAMGATHSVSRRLGDWWVTVLGEAPMDTLRAFAQALERKK